MKVCVVVGAGDGLGLAIVNAFSKQGFHVLAARRKAVTELNSASITSVDCDARQEEDVKRLFDFAESKGKLDVVVHNIGANVTFPITETTDRVFRKVWEMCALTAFLVGRESAKRMIPEQSGCVIFTGATASTRGAAGYTAFGAAMASKRSIAQVRWFSRLANCGLQLTRETHIQSMARELGPKNIHVAHVVIDGPIDSHVVEKRVGADLFKAMQERQALLRTEEIAKIYTHIASQERSAWTFETDVRPWSEKF